MSDNERDRYPRLVRSENFPAMTVDHFRALMQRLERLHASANGWIASNGERLRFGEERQMKYERHERVDVTPPTRGSWCVLLFGPERVKSYAAIEAYQQPDHVKLDFFDGSFPDVPGVPYPPIGAAFDEFCDMIVNEAESPSELVQQSASQDHDEVPAAPGDAWVGLRSDIRKRREHVLLLRRAGHKIDDIVEATGTPKRTIEHDITWLNRQELI